MQWHQRDSWVWQINVDQFLCSFWDAVLHTGVPRLLGCCSRLNKASLGVELPRELCESGTDISHGWCTTGVISLSAHVVQWVLWGVVFQINCKMSPFNTAVTQHLYGCDQRSADLACRYWWFQVPGSPLERGDSQQRNLQPEASAVPWECCSPPCSSAGISQAPWKTGFRRL